MPPAQQAVCRRLARSKGDCFHCQANPTVRCRSRARDDGSRRCPGLRAVQSLHDAADPIQIHHGGRRRDRLYLWTKL
jgi:hypothetical protein